jgi:steroid 5-alpha reductase family enzyme
MSNVKRSLTSLTVVLMATAMGSAFAWFAGVNQQIFTGHSVLFVCALIAFAVNWLAFIPSAIAQTEKFYDLVGSITYLTLMGVACWIAAPLDTKAIVVAAMVAIWALRLGSFLFARIGRDGKDSRFDKIKVNPARFLVAWTLQANWAIFTAAAAVTIIGAADRGSLGLYFWVGAAVWLVGFIIEVIADRQKGAFKNNPANEDKFIDTGLWAWSQHPNYFGELMLWTGITIIALPLLSGWGYLVLLSPIFVTLLLTKLSGIPMLDAKAKQRWGDDPAYQSYRAKTSKLIPLPPK